MDRHMNGAANSSAAGYAVQVHCPNWFTVKRMANILFQSSTKGKFRVALDRNGCISFHRSGLERAVRSGAAKRQSSKTSKLP